MSLIAKVYTPTPISQWFAERNNCKVDKIMYSANQHLNKFAASPRQSEHRGLVKAAAVYATLKHMGYISGSTKWLTRTYAYRYISKSEFYGLFNGRKYKPTKTVSDEAMNSLQNAALDISYRIYREHQFIIPFVKAWKNRETVNPNEHWHSQWLSTSLIVEEIVGNIARCWQSVGDGNSNYLYEPIPNPTFSLSNQIGGAQADLIFKNTLTNVILDRCLTIQEFQKAIAYLLLDTNNEYQIKQIAWLFPLQQTSITVQVSELFHNIDETRCLFKQMIDDNYQIDEFNQNGDGIDSFQYINRYC